MPPTFLVPARTSTLLVLVTALVFGGCNGARNTAKAPGPSNALLIILDTTRADALSCYSHGPTWTPNLDALAAQGCRFTDAEAHCPFTLGSISTILTSLPPDVHGIKGHGGYGLDERAVTLAETFKASGYTTAAFVSAFPLSADTGISQGFDLYDDDFSMDYPIYDPEYLPQAESRTGAERRGNVTVDHALAWLKHNRSPDAPFFLLIHLFDPHQPYDPPPRFNRIEGLNPYLGEVAFADSLVGAVLRALDERDLLESTVVTVVGDHGEAFHEHNEVGHGFLLYDTTLHVPWILSGPGIPRTEVAGPVGLVDLAPTFLSACGLAQPKSFEGRNVLGDRTGPAPDRTPPSPIYSETYYPRVVHGWSELLAWREADWKYIRGPKPELFDLGHDPKELENLIAREPEKAQAMRAALDAYLARDVSTELTARLGAPDPEARERLQSLGYLGGNSNPKEDLAEAGWDLGLPDPKDRLQEWNQEQEITGRLRHCRALAMSGHQTEAVQAYEKLLDAQPKDADTWMGLATSLFELGRIDRAETAFRNALRFQPSLSEANFNLGLLLVRTGRFDEAIPYYAKVLDLEPENIPARIDLARIYVKTGQRDLGIQTLEEAHRIDPEDGTTLLLLGQLRLEDGRAEDGMALLRTFLDLYPDRPEAANISQLLAQQ